jgi:hypothetical protein
VNLISWQSFGLDIFFTQISTGTAEQGCQIFLGTTHQNGGNVPNDHSISQTVVNILNGHKIYTNIFHSKAVRNIGTQIGIIGIIFGKYTIWQQRRRHCGRQFLNEGWAPLTFAPTEKFLPSHFKTFELGTNVLDRH